MRGLKYDAKAIGRSAADAADTPSRAKLNALGRSAADAADTPSRAKSNALGRHIAALRKSQKMTRYRLALRAQLQGGAE